MRARVQKWGNSLALRIPKAFAENLQVREDSIVDLVVGEEGLLVKPVVPKYALADLLAQVTDDNIHGEIGTGKPVGREVW